MIKISSYLSRFLFLIAGYTKSLPTGVEGRLFDCNYMVTILITTEKQLHLFLQGISFSGQ